MAFFEDWGPFVAAFVVFFLTHAIPVRPAVKGPVVARFGARAFTIGYSALSTAVLAWLIHAAIHAPQVVLWHWMPWQNHVPQLGMALACLVAALALGRPNPLSFGGAANSQFNPDAPGIVGWVRHPLLLALALWSASHIVPNGTVALVLLFGTFTGFSLLGMRLIDQRKKRQLGSGEWSRLASAHRRVRVTANGALRVLAAGLVYGALLWAHGPVIGVVPVP